MRKQRRSFLQGLIASATMLGASLLPFGLGRLLSPAVAHEYSRHLRPPGALADDAAFVAACIGCGLCGEVCPPRCILFDEREGGNEVNTPYINPEHKACTLCAKCMDVCPTEAITRVERDEIKMGIAQIDRSACYPWVDRGVCGACVTICPLGEKGIVFEFANMYRPVVVENGCVGCGLCVEVCPHPSLPIRIVEPAMGTVTKHAI
ncbi:MAG TPA: 4Fe-4S dicluster domain-containing protein [Gammaproteobacteria bacterium]|nr:4Fe-4S dicluster domain-containing protein [Gammaproteobacteria bacterium]